MNRSDLLVAVRDVVEANLPAGFVEAPRYKRVTTWVVPAELSPRTHDGSLLPILALGQRKTYVSLYVMGLAWDSRMRAWFDDAWRASGCRLDRGKVAVRMRDLNDVPLDVIAATVRFMSVDDAIAAYERHMAESHVVE